MKNGSDIVAWPLSCFDADCIDDRISCFEKLLSQDPSILTFAHKGRNLLLESIGSGDYGVLDWLLKRGANPNGTARQFNTPLCEATRPETGPSSLAMMQLLLDAGADPNQLGQDGTPLHNAVRSNSLEKASLLLNNRANVNAVREDGETPLWLAVQMCNFAMCGLLLTFGADMTIRDDFLRLTPLALCQQNPISDERDRIIKLLTNSQDGN